MRAGQLVVQPPIVVLGPGVEPPVGEGDPPLAVAHEDRAGITRPSAIGGPAVEIYLIEIDAGAMEHSPHTFFGGGILDDQLHALMRGEQAHDFGIEPGNGRKFAGPSSGLCGHASQVASCGSHSAGMW